MMAKKSLAVVVAMAAMAATTAVPAFAQEDGEMMSVPPVGPAEGGQYAPVGETQQEALPAFPVAGSGRYAPATSGEYASISGAPASAESGKKTAIKGVFSVEEGGWSFVTDEKTGQEYYLVGVIGVDPEDTAGKTVIAKGIAECGHDGPVYGCTLGVSSITPIGKGAERGNAPTEPPAPTDDTAPDEQTLPFEVPTPDEDGASPGRQDGTGADYDKGTVVVSGDISNDRGGGSLDAGGSGSVVASGGAGQGGASPVASVLPATGGALPIAGAAGLLIVAAGLPARRLLR